MASASCRTSHAKAKSWVSRPPFGSCAQLWDGRNKAGPPPNGPSVRLELAPGESVAAFGRRAFECSAPRHSSSSALECTRKCRTKLLCDDDKLCMWFGSGGGGVGAGGKGRVRVRFRGVVLSWFDVGLDKLKGSGATDRCSTMNSWALSTTLIPTTSSYGMTTPPITSADHRGAPQACHRC